jgi:16S rRNA (guanine527-N7)-methyltransferase
MDRSSHSRPPRGGARGTRRDDASSSRPSPRSRDERPRGGGARDGGARDGGARDERFARGRGERAPRDGGARDERFARGRDERAPRGGGARPTPSRAGARDSQRPAASRSADRTAPRPAQRATQRVTPRPASRLANPVTLLARQPWASLRPLIPGTEGEVESRLGALRGFAKQLLEWNRGVSNLISRHDESRLVERHLFESLYPAKAIVESGSRRFVDFGSGAGLPAIPLALCGIGEHWTLVESRRNKTLFMRKVMQDNGLRNLEVKVGRLEVLVDEDADSLACDTFTSRATTTIGPTLELATRIVGSGGRAFLWKGSSYEQEIASTEDAWGSSWRLERATKLGDGPNVIAVFIRL